LDTVTHVRDKVDREREEAIRREAGLRAQLADKVKKGEVVQKELSVQLRCAGRSYAQILDANREIGEQMHIEIDKRDDEIAALHKIIKKRDEVIRVADAPWKAEIAKTELKILKLQENNADLKKKVKEESAKVAPVHEHYKKQIIEKEAAMVSVLKETEILREEIDVILAAHEIELAKVQAPFGKQILDLNKINREILEVAEDKEAHLKREVKKLENKLVGMQKELDKVDHTPYERKIDTLQDGFNRLVKDFEIKTQLNSENVVKMREGFENVIEGLDHQIQKHQAHAERQLKPYLVEIAKKQSKIEQLELRLEEIKGDEHETREKEAAAQKDLREELKVCKEAVDLYLGAMNKAKRELETAKLELDGDDGPRKKMKAYERRLEEVTLQCAQLIQHKDFELQEKTAIVSRLQTKLQQDSKRFEDFAEMWDKRIQEKEKGFNKAIAELTFAEGQIVVERKRTQVEKVRVQQRDERIQTLQKDHDEELRVREKYRLELEVIIEGLEERVATVEEEKEIAEGVRHRLMAEMDTFRRRSEEVVADLRTEMDRRDRLREEVDVKLLEAQAQLVTARSNWDEKERELEVYIRTRDRAILALKNELEFLNDNWEIKYSRLVSLYEKLQKKYEETIGANGVQEAFRRALGLKAENEALHTMIHELRETVQKQKKAIRGLQLDYDQLMKETADVIAEKERGIAEMAGDFVKLENKYRDEQTLRARLLKQKDAERLALAESFQARVEQLEQIMEAMRFNDRPQLMDKIKLWKKNYERVCCERDEVEDHYKELLEVKEAQLQNMMEENSIEREKTATAHLDGQQALELCEVKWKKAVIVVNFEKEELDKEILALKVELDMAKFQADREKLLNARPKEDPQIAILKEKIKDLEDQLVQVEAGKAAIIAENAALQVTTESVDNVVEDVHAIYQPQLKQKDKEMKLMEIRHEELKEILKLEMQRAQDTCKDIENQVKRFPEPFIEEIQEMKDKYAQMQAGMQKIQVENLMLQEKCEKTSKDLGKEIKDLEKSLSLAKTLLHEVSTLEALKHLHSSEARRAEEDLGLKLGGG